MSRKAISLILIAFGFSILYSYIPCASMATAQVEGYITEDTIWSLENSPYIIVNDIIVEPGVKLTITPGVVVKFANGTNMIIDGTLIGSGNETYRVKFTSNNTIPKPGDWGHIWFRSTSVSSILNWTTVEYGVKAIYVYRYGSNVSILNSEIRYNQYAALVEPYSILKVRNCNFMNNTYGIYSEPESTLEVQTCHFMNNTRGITAEEDNTKIYTSTFFDNGEAIYAGLIRLEVYSSNFSRNMWAIRGRRATLYITGSSIIDNNHGLCCPNIEVSCSIISGNQGTGIACNYSLQITNCTITDNQQNGITCEGYNPAQKEIHFCNIYNNTPYDVFNKEYFGFDVNATLNWWGTENETYIEEKIYDYYDDYSYSKVIFKPYLNEPAIISEGFSSLLVMMLFMIATLPAVIVYRRKRPKSDFAKSEVEKCSSSRMRIYS